MSQVWPARSRASIDRRQHQRGRQLMTYSIAAPARPVGRRLAAITGTAILSVSLALAMAASASAQAPATAPAAPAAKPTPKKPPAKPAAAAPAPAAPAEAQQ